MYLLSIMNISDIRRRNARYLAELIGGITALGKKLNKSQQQMTHIIGKNPTKNIGHSLAKQIEFAFGKENGWMDHEHPELWGGEEKTAKPLDEKFKVFEPPDVYTNGKSDPLAGLTEKQRELLMMMDSLTEKQQEELLNTARQRKQENQEILDALSKKRMA